MTPDIAYFPTVIAGLFDDDWAEALLTLVLTLEADLLTLGDAPVEWVQ